MNLIQKNRTFFSKNNPFLWILVVWVISLSFRINVYDPTIPIFMDSLNFFSYAIDIHVSAGLPEGYAVTKPGWSVFLAGLFSIFDFAETNSYMQLQRMSSLIISSLAIFPLYFLCNLFVEKKYSIIGATLFAFAPRLIENSMYGTTEPLYILFLTVTILCFLKNSKLIYISFLLAGISTTIRPESFFLFLAMSFMLIFKLKSEKFKFPKYILAITIFLIVSLPFVLHTEHIYPETSIFSRIIDSTAQYFQTSDEEIRTTVDNRLITTSKLSLVTGIEYFGKYLGWVMIPMFIITAPIGFILFLKNRSYTKISVIVMVIIISIPAFYAYSFPLPETKYLYFLFPLFSVFSVIPIKLFVEKFQKKNLVILVILSIIILSSILFYYYQFDPNHKVESTLIAKNIVDNTTMVNTYYPESIFIQGIGLPEKWSELVSYHKNFEPDHNKEYAEKIYKQLPNKVIRINPNSFETIESLLHASENQLSHIVIDSKNSRPEFLKHVFTNEDSYSYLIKEWDSKDDGFAYHVKIFRIDYELFNLGIEK